VLPAQAIKAISLTISYEFGLIRIKYLQLNRKERKEHKKDDGVLKIFDYSCAEGAISFRLSPG
jgi:hypothetical protein